VDRGARLCNTKSGLPFPRFQDALVKCFLQPCFELFCSFCGSRPSSEIRFGKFSVFFSRVVAMIRAL